MSDFVQADQLVGSRYRLTEKEMDQLPYEGTSLWRGTDTTLRRGVRILVLSPKAPHFSEVLDAARRCSLFDDPHAVHILSVGADTRCGWIVTEVPLGMPLSHRLTGTPFPADQARAIVGETATILASARSRGIRHLQLSPDDVRIDASGEVYLEGLAIKAALAGIRTDSMLANEVDKLDAEGLAKLYCSLLAGKEAGQAPDCYVDLQKNAKLDEETSFFFEKEIKGTGTLSASDVIRTLAPWPEVEVPALPYAPGTEPVEHSPEEVDPELGIVPPPSMTTNPAWPSTTGKVSEPPAFPPIPAAFSSAEEGAGAEGVNNEAAAEASAPDAAADEASNEDTPTRSTRSAATSKEGEPTHHLSAVAAGGMHKIAASKPAQAARSSIEKQVDKVSVVPEDGSARRFNTSWLFMAISLVLVVVGGIWAFGLFFTPPKVQVTDQGPTGPLNRDISGLSQDEDTTAASEILSATLLNPQAGQVPTSDIAAQDNPDTVENLIDDDTSTVWSSWWYPTPNYTYGKDGIGLMIKLTHPMVVENVHLQVNGNGGLVQWRNTTEADPAGGEVIDEGAMSTTTYLIAPIPMETDTIILWFPELPKDSVEKNRLTIAEINFNKPIPDAIRAQNDEATQ